MTWTWAYIRDDGHLQQHARGRRHRATLRCSAADAQGKEASARYARARDVERQALALLEEHRIDTLRLGAPGRLSAAAAVEVLPLDDARLLD
jgi:hypothetical protein